jgi:ubiquitin C-terminal hydrolase
MEDKKFQQTTLLKKFPKYLIIQLGRFVSGVLDERWWSNKINLDVHFPITNLDMSTIFPSPSEIAPSVYDLFAVAVRIHSNSNTHVTLLEPQRRCQRRALLVLCPRRARAN